ncbi:MAG: hypothetical protein COT74_05145 [Bdellovibrionales bacterium CG10_big_fil_rev_8_21_14_0_10_45_34]|nr:MAG: hypothetical protein COT74_05145 [Bdellovibrionales bacterium CG10_big_fil_rev_8_21_14_0_10_45_34]
MIKFVLSSSLAILLAGCSSFSKRSGEVHDDISRQNYSSAIERLRPLALSDSKDQLVYLLDYATVLFMAGQYQESAQAFIKADKLAEIQDYHSLSKVTASILLDEGQVQYKGDAYEVILINAYLALNFLMLGQLDDALVECRRINEKLTRYKNEAKRDYEQSSFARYLAAVIWEAKGQFTDAYLDYKFARDIDPSIPTIGEDLIRTAFLSRRWSDLKKWQAEYPDIKMASEWKNKNYGEIVYLFARGRGPIKQPHPASHRVPKLYPRSTLVQGFNVKILNGAEAVLNEIPSVPVYSVEEAAIKTLDGDYAGLIAKRAVGVGAKAVIADQVRQKSEALGALAWIGMNLVDQADLRQWSLLPKDFQIARVYLPAGKYEVSADAIGYANESTYSSSEAIELKPRKKALRFMGLYR